MPLFVLRNYAGIAEGWCAGQTGPDRAIAEKKLRRLDLEVRWEYALALINTLFTDVSQKKRVPV